MNSFMICHPSFELFCHPVYDLSSRAKRGICSLLNIKRIARKLESTDGAEIAEAALVLPLVFMFLLGIIWFGRAFNIYSTITQAAERGAITAARPTCAVGCGSNFPSDIAVDNSVFAVMQASSLDPSQIILPPDPPAQDCPDPIPNHTCSHINNIVV